MSQLTIDQAIADLQAVVREELGDDPPTRGPTKRPIKPPEPPRTPKEKEEELFRFAEFMVTLACPDPKLCADQTCRRNATCRHLARVRAKRASDSTSHPRRSPGAEAARYAIWAYMSSGR
jgi:hypothetical protein